MDSIITQNLYTSFRCHYSLRRGDVTKKLFRWDRVYAIRTLCVNDSGSPKVASVCLPALSLGGGRNGAVPTQVYRAETMLSAYDFPNKLPRCKQRGSLFKLLELISFSSLMVQFSSFQAIP